MQPCRKDTKLAFHSGTLTGWENDLDRYARNVNSQQTVGIPIGPDTSLLLSEVILSRIDTELRVKFPKLVGIRFIDDYEFAVATLSEAENVLSHLQHLLSEYELAVNPKKTRILELPDSLDVPWVSSLRVFKFRYRTPSNQLHDLTEYFNTVFRFYEHYKDEGVIKYAIGRLRSVDIDESNFEYFQNLLSHCIVVEPAAIRQVWDQISYYASIGFKVDKALWKNALNQIVFENSPLGHTSESAWAMWVLKELRQKLLVKSQKVVAQTEDCIVGLMGLWLAEEGLANPDHLAPLRRFRSENHLWGSNWLLCYEGNFQRWFGTRWGRRRLRSIPAFQMLENRNVSFLDKTIVHVPGPRTPIARYHHFGGGGSGDD